MNKIALDALKAAKYAIKGREHTGFIDDAIAALEAEAVQVEPDLERECDDTDKLLRLLGLNAVSCRTEGGSINLPKIKAILFPEGEPHLYRVHAYSCEKEAEDGGKCCAHWCGNQSGCMVTLRKTPDLAVQVEPVTDFPPRIMAILLDVARREDTEFEGVWDENGNPLQDDADAALAWIKSHATPQDALDRQAREIDLLQQVTIDKDDETNRLTAEIEAMRAQPVQPAQQEAAPAWQPIATAPADGSFFIATDGNGFKVLNHPPKHYMGVWIWNEQRKQWSGAVDTSIDPTHWTQILALPKDAS